MFNFTWFWFCSTIFYIDQGHLYDPTDMQNLLLLMIGCFGSYVYLIDLFFDGNSKQIIQNHLIGVVLIFLILGFLSGMNANSRGIELEDMPNTLPLFDSVVFLFLLSFLMIFMIFLLVDWLLIPLMRKTKKIPIAIRNRMT